MGTTSSTSMFAMAMNMTAKYDKYWANWSNINHFLFVAIVLDPRFKLKGLEFCLRKMFANNFKTKLDDIQNHLNDLFMHYSLQPSPSNIVPSSSPKKSGDVMDFDFVGEDFYSMMEREMGGDEKNDVNELNAYLNDASEKGGNLDVLGWWKSNSLKYPIMSHIAKDILAIPVSTVASEQAFSIGGRVIDANRSSLNPTKVEALVCSQNWIRRPEILVEIFEAMDEAEKYEEIAQESSSSCLTTITEDTDGEDSD